LNGTYTTRARSRRALKETHNMQTSNTPVTNQPNPKDAVGHRARAARTWDLINKSGIVVVFLVLFVTLSLTVPDFISSRNIQGLLLSVTLIGSISVTMMFVLALGEVDLSVASIVAFAGVVASTSESWVVFWREVRSGW
jgi:L-arabinose transport system permease protein